MAGRPDRPPAGTVLDAVARVLGCVVLVGVGAGLLLFALELLSAAGGHHVAALAALPAPGSQPTHMLVFAGVFMLLIVVLALETRHAVPVLVFSRDDGALVVSEEAVADLVASTLAAHADVLQTRSSVTAAGDGVDVATRVRLRPLADVTRLETELGDLVRRGVPAATGLTVGRLRLTLRVVGVSRLPRYLSG